MMLTSLPERRILFSGTPFPRGIVALDGDNTSYGWAKLDMTLDEVSLQRSLSAFGHPEIQRQNSFILLTARSLSNMKVLASLPKIQPLLKAMNPRFIATNNGTEVFEKKNRQISTADWILNLKPKNADRKYNRFVQQATHWNNRKVGDIIHKTLSEYGFRQQSPSSAPAPGFETYALTVPGLGDVLVGRFPDEPVMEVAYSSPAVRAAVEPTLARLADNIQTVLRRSGIPSLLESAGMHNARKSKDGKYVYDWVYRYVPILPVENDRPYAKADALKYLLSRIPGVQYVITGGDNTNDAEMLRQSTYTNAEKQDVPNYPIQAGSHPQLTSILKDHARRVQVGVARVGDGILKQWQQVKTDFIKAASA